jgi:predicted transcriptional regulator
VQVRLAPLAALALAFSLTLLTPIVPALALAMAGLLVPLYTRLAREHLLEDGLRPRIVELLRAEPGLGITDVCARLDIGWGTAVHHLTRLENAGLVVSQDSGRRRRFFLPSEPAQRRTALCVLSSDLNRRLLELVQARPGLTQQEVCAALSISAPLAHKYLARLIRDEFVTTQREWRSVRYYASPRTGTVLTEFALATGTARGEGPSRPADPGSGAANRGPPPG